MKAVFLDFDTLGPTDINVAPLANLLPGLTLHGTTPAKQIDERIHNAEIVITNKVTLDRNTLENAARLKLICLAATGTDNVDLRAAKQQGVAVCNITSYCTASVVQHVFGLILALTHHLQEYAALLQSGSWKDSSQFCLLNYPIRELKNKTLGIVGLGTLGFSVAAIGQAFGMKVLAAQRPYDQERPAINHSETGPGIQRTGFRSLLERSDVISLHCPLTDETRHLIDARALDTMRRDAILINTARGGLIDSAALIIALKAHGIAGAGIDVLPQEPPVDGDPLLELHLPNLIVTPHIAWAAQEARQRALDEIAACITNFLNGGNRNRIV
jgi:glycerate dehydrogenase